MRYIWSKNITHIISCSRRFLGLRKIFYLVKWKELITSIIGFEFSDIYPFAQVKIVAYCFAINLFTADDNPESLSPVGGMPFLADSMIAYGPLFFLPVLVLAASLFWVFRRAGSSWRALLMLSIMSGSQQLWRESYANGIKTILEPYILQYLVLWLATFTILAFPISRARELCEWRAEHSS